MRRICDRRRKGLFWTVFEDMTTDEGKFLNKSRMPRGCFEVLYETARVFATQETQICGNIPRNATYAS